MQDISVHVTTFRSGRRIHTVFVSGIDLHFAGERKETSKGDVNRYLANAKQQKALIDPSQWTGANRVVERQHS